MVATIVTEGREEPGCKRVQPRMNNEGGIDRNECGAVLIIGSFLSMFLRLSQWFRLADLF